MEMYRTPPGLSWSESESSTASRERRRVALAAKVAVKELSGEMCQQFDALFQKFDRLANMLQDGLGHRVSRLETLMVCSTPLRPSVDEVLSEMLFKKKEVYELDLIPVSSNSCSNYEIFSDDGNGMPDSYESLASTEVVCQSILTGDWVPLPTPVESVNDAFMELGEGFEETCETKHMSLMGFKDVSNTVKMFLISAATPIDKLTDSYCKLTHRESSDTWFSTDGVKEFLSLETLMDSDVIFVHDRIRTTPTGI